MKTTQQPHYYLLEPKIQARQLNIRYYRELTNKHQIPENKEYWTLCNEQPDHHGAEINQMHAEGLIQKHQFVGVDNNQNIINNNKIHHPQANWLHGDWIDIITNNEFNPALVYLDTTSIVGNKKILKLVSDTILICPKDTVLIVNAMLTNPRNNKIYDADHITNNLGKHVGPEFKNWKKEIKNFTYQSSRTAMISYVFYKTP